MKPWSLTKILTNPLIWIGLTLTYMTIHNEGLNSAFDVFYNPITYRNLFIGSAIYVVLFDRHYTKNYKKLDYLETFVAIIEKMAIILFIWLFTLSIYTSYHNGGEAYSNILRARYLRMQNAKNI
ncbi:MAG: hypothetical protein IJZ30_03475 [Alphaproteobacteria bacterium]|nr:hypothetical protein [Alphaproteobacteria bacterium]